MILSDFVLTGFSHGGAGGSLCFAEVTVTTTTGALWWKKAHTLRRKIARYRFGVLWFFVDDGTPTPGFQAENLERSFKATNQLPVTK
jgi:hypothetical protein